MTSTADERAPRVPREHTGKRSIRRRENARFTHNPHVAPPTSLDLDIPLQLPSSTFPHPLPPYLPRSLPAPHARPPPTASGAAFFSFSLRGARRTLRARPYSAHLVKAIETHLAAWLDGGTYLLPDHAKGLLSFPGVPVGGRDDVREVAREAGRLVWAIKAGRVDQYGDGGFERYIVHCVARWYGVVSFSKETDGRRLTYLLRPNMTRSGPRADAHSRALDTPPATDASDANASDFHTTDSESATDVDSAPENRADAPSGLSDIEESRSSSPDSWSLVDAAASMESLSLSSVHADVDDDDDEGVPTPRRSRIVEQEGNTPTPSRARTDRLHRLYPRSGSSPSPHRFSIARNPATRRKKKARMGKKGFAGALTDKGSFYDYLFA